MSKREGKPFCRKNENLKIRRIAVCGGRVKICIKTFVRPCLGEQFKAKKLSFLTKHENKKSSYSTELLLQCDLFF